MKKAKALQDFWWGKDKITKGEVLDYTSGFGYGNCRAPSFIVETNPHVFECPYEEKLTSDQWDEKARGYGYWIPRDGEKYYITDLINGNIIFQYWHDDNFDMALLRAGLAFETREEAKELLAKLKKEKPL